MYTTEKTAGGKKQPKGAKVEALLCIEGNQKWRTDEGTHVN